MAQLGERDQVIQDQKEALEITLQSIGDAVIATDTAGNITRMNPVAERLTAWDTAQAQGRALTEVVNIVGSKTGQTVENPVEKVLENDQTVGMANHTKLRAGDGREYQIADSAAPIRDAHDTVVGVVLVFRDVTDDYKMRASLEEREERYRTVFETVLNGIVLADFEGRVQDVNPAACDIYGYAREEMIGMAATELVHPDYHDTFQAFLEAVQRDGSISGDTVDVRKDGSLINVHVRGTMLRLEGRNYFAAVLDDITEQKQAEAERERLKLAIEEAAEAFMITDREGTIGYVNPAFEKITGYKQQEAVGRTPRILKSGEHDESFYRELWRTLGNGETWSGQLVNRRKDGTLYTDQTVISPVRNQTGKIENYVAVKRDITEELKREEQLRHAQKLESLGQLAGGVAHDFNNVLTGLFGNVSVAKSRLDSQHPAFDSLEKAEQALDRATRLTHQLLTFAAGGEEAVQRYREAMEAEGPFDAVILDLTVPGGMGGEEAIKHLLALDPNARVIVSSGYADTPAMAQYAEYGFKGVVKKPFTINGLREALNRVLHG